MLLCPCALAFRRTERAAVQLTCWATACLAPTAAPQTEGPWVLGDLPASLADPAALEQLQAQFSLLDTSAKLKILVALAALRRRDVVPLASAFDMIIAAAASDVEPWVRLVAQMVAPLPRRAQISDQLADADNPLDSAVNELLGHGASPPGSHARHVRARRAGLTHGCAVGETGGRVHMHAQLTSSGPRRTLRARRPTSSGPRTRRNRPQHRTLSSPRKHNHCRQTDASGSWTLPAKLEKVGRALCVWKNPPPRPHTHTHTHTHADGDSRRVRALRPPAARSAPGKGRDARTGTAPPSLAGMPTHTSRPSAPFRPGTRACRVSCGHSQHRSQPAC